MDHENNPDVLAQKPVGERTVIANSFTIEGELEAKEDTLIQGKIKGNIIVEDHTVRIGKQAEVNGEIFANRVILEGKVDGQLRAKEAVNLRQTADVKGTILAPKVGMEEGCQFDGEVKMDASALSVASARAQQRKKGSSAKS
jgi:cytoskeletal protein CcmA (bactofilin family)